MYTATTKRKQGLRTIKARLHALEKLQVVREAALREFLAERDRRITEQFEAQDKLTKTAFASSEQAINKAEANQTVLNQKGNEFRGQLDDQAKTLMGRNEYLSQHASLQQALEVLRGSVGVLKEDLRKEMAIQKDDLRKDLAVQKEDARKEVDSLRLSRAVGTGVKQGINVVWVVAIAAIGLFLEIFQIAAMLWFSIKR